ncbi:MAG TPA: C1 family peptidase [Allosphingosinicella sp.]|nr:C1 family peptidase [Allosphingosinicella sp.]
MAKAKSKTRIKRILNVFPSVATEMDWQFENALEAEAIAAPPLALPASVDLRKPWWEIGDQEATGSCVGWASTDAVARYSFVQAGRLATTARLSPRFTWMASKETDEFTARPGSFIEEGGTSLKAALDILRKYGAAPEELLPFKLVTTLYPGREADFYATCATRKIAAYFNLKKNYANWRSWLAAHGPLLVALKVDKSWQDCDSTGKLDVFQPAPRHGGHAVAVVGYRADGRFILRNSWGKTWGDQGFAYASEAYIKDAFFDEAYGITL